MKFVTRQLNFITLQHAFAILAAIRKTASVAFRGILAKEAQYVDTKARVV